VSKFLCSLISLGILSASPTFGEEKVEQDVPPTSQAEPAPPAEPATVPTVAESWTCPPRLNDSSSDLNFLVKGKLTLLSVVANTPGKEGAYKRVNLLESDMIKLESTLVSAFEMAYKHRFLAPAFPTKGILTLGFEGEADKCAAGKATVQGIKLTSPPQVLTNLPIDNYALFESDRGPKLATQEGVLQVDPVNLQTRQEFVIPKGQIPLYLSYAERYLMTWNPDKKSIERHTLDLKPKLIGAIEVKAPFFFSSHDHIKFARWAESGNELKVEDPFNPQKVVGISLPKEYDLKNAEFRMDKPGNLLAVFGKDPETRRIWDKLFIFDLRTGKIVTEFKVSKGNYVSDAGFHPSSSRLIVLIKGFDNRALKGANVWLPTPKKWKNLHMVLR
jgi:hypothetical protein